MNVLLTGASGFIGCRLLANLEQAGHTIRLISRKSIGQYDQVICDFTSDKVPHKALEGVDTVYHLASFAHDLREASGNEHVYRTVNLDTTVRLAELAVAAKAQRFIFVSSVKAGGRLILGRCANENDQNKSVGIYGRTKQQAEVELLKIGKKSGMHVSIIRPSLVYGPRMKGNLAVMQAGVKKGWFPPLPETGNRRSMIHVDDLVRALVFVVENEQANGQIYIATDGVPHSSREIYEAICHSVGKVPRGWCVPKWVFGLAGAMSSKVRFKLDKLLGDECYSSAKLEALGFKTEKGLMDLARSDFDVSDECSGELQSAREGVHSS